MTGAKGSLLSLSHPCRGDGGDPGPSPGRDPVRGSTCCGVNQVSFGSQSQGKVSTPLTLSHPLPPKESTSTTCSGRETFVKLPSYPTPPWTLIETPTVSHRS